MSRNPTTAEARQGITRVLAALGIVARSHLETKALSVVQDDDLWRKLPAMIPDSHPEWRSVQVADQLIPKGLMRLRLAEYVFQLNPGQSKGLERFRTPAPAASRSKPTRAALAR